MDCRKEILASELYRFVKKTFRKYYYTSTVENINANIPPILGRSLDCMQMRKQIFETCTEIAVRNCVHNFQFFFTVNEILWNNQSLAEIYAEDYHYNLKFRKRK